MVDPHFSTFTLWCVQSMRFPMCPDFFFPRKKPFHGFLSRIVFFWIRHVSPSLSFAIFSQSKCHLNSSLCLCLYLFLSKTNLPPKRSLSSDPFVNPRAAIKRGSCSLHLLVANCAWECRCVCVRHVRFVQRRAAPSAACLRDAWAWRRIVSTQAPGGHRHSLGSAPICGSHTGCNYTSSKS